MPNPHWLNRLWRYGPLLFWLLVIFSASTDHLGKQETSRFFEPFLKGLFSTFSDETIDLMHVFIRKCGHFFEYALLAFLASRAFLSSTKIWLRHFWVYWSLLVITLYSFTDEYHQSFETTRSASPFDCLIDITGGLSLLLIYSYFRNQKIKKEKINNGK